MSGPRHPRDTIGSMTSPLRSPLRHLNAPEVSRAAKQESRNREVFLPPVSVYRWWARRTQADNAAVIRAFEEDFPGERFLVVDPFSGGGVIPLTAVQLSHRTYAQDLNPWAAHGLTAALRLPDADV